MAWRQQIRAACQLLAGLVAAAASAGTAAGAEGWVNARVPVAAHLGAPENGVASGLHLDLLAVFPITGGVSSDLDAYTEYRLGVGPAFELRTLDLDRLGAGAGLEVLLLAPSGIRRVNLGAAAEIGVSKWLAGATTDSWATYLSLALQLRAGGTNRGPTFVHTTALLIRAERSSADNWSFVAGPEFGGDPVSWLAFMSGGRL